MLNGASKYFLLLLLLNCMCCSAVKPAILHPYSGGTPLTPPQLVRNSIPICTNFGINLYSSWPLDKHNLNIYIVTFIRPPVSLPLPLATTTHPPFPLQARASIKHNSNCSADYIATAQARQNMLTDGSHEFITIPQSSTQLCIL